MTSGIGLLARDGGGAVDFERLRRERRARCLAAMERRDIDLMLLGRQNNARYASGVSGLWHAGTRGFTPGCAVVRESGEVHVLAQHDDGVPPEIPREHLFRFGWNPRVTLESLLRIPGVRGARRVGVDGMTPVFAALLAEALPGADFADAEELLSGVRCVKSGDELACLRAAVAVSEAALESALDALEPGGEERELLGVFQERMGALGVTVPAAQGVFCATPTVAGPDGRVPLRRLPDGRALRAGDLVALDGGVMYAGYEGGVGRSWPCGGVATPAQRDLQRRWRSVMDALLEACRPGRPCSDLLVAHEQAGEALPDFPIAHGLGLGYEPPCVGAGLEPRPDVCGSLRAGMVLSLQSYVWREGVGGYLGRELVHVAESGVEVLSTLACDLAA